MKAVFNVEGMMCVHCENRVKDSIRKLSGIGSLDVSSEKGTVEVEFSAPATSEMIKNAIEDTGYDVV